MIYDAAVIGTGPAGVSAALTLKANNKEFLLLGNPDFSDKVGRAERIANYPGLSMVTGAEMNEAFGKQLREAGIAVTDRMVTSVVWTGDHYALMAGADFYEAYTVILTTGVAATGTLPGEAELVGRGVSYCATCDGNLYRGKTIGVICGAARFEHEAAFLAGLAKKMYFFPLYQSAASFGENTEVTADRPVAVLSDGKRVSGVKLKSGTELALDGLFCLRDSVSLAALLPDLAMEDGHIATDRSMKTNLPGCFAAGDCTGRPYQYVKAAGEGNVAAHSAIAYLAGKQ